MKIPRKIDDRLQDAIVSLQFKAGVPAKTVEGYFFSLLRDKFHEVSLELSTPVHIDQVVIQPQQSFYLHEGGRFRVEISPEIITFNLIDGYAGWNEYFQVITETLTPLFDNKVITAVNRIGIRYISVFDRLGIFDNINPVISFAPFDSQSLRSQFRIELDRKPFLVIATLLNSFPRQPGSEASDFYSIIDLDTIKLFKPSQESLKETLGWLDQGHSEQKGVFFSLLKQEFIDSLNPEY